MNPLKKYFIFAISFLIMFSILQVLSGVLLTATYTPEITTLWNQSAQLTDEVVMYGTFNPFLITVLTAFLSATIAYFIPNISMKHKQRDN